MHEDILVDIKEALASNMLDDLSKLEKPTYIDIDDMFIECRFTEVDDLHGMYKYAMNLNWVRREIYNQQVANITKNPTRIIKRIVARLEAQSNPRKHKNSINDDDIERARGYSIEEMFEGQLHPAGGGRQKGICPFHKEQSASFYIFKDNKAHCFGCAWHGDAISFYMALHGVEFIPAVRALMNR